MDCGKGIFRRQTRKTHRSVTKRRSILALILRHSLESIAKLEAYQHHIFLFRPGFPVSLSPSSSNAATHEIVN